MVRFCKALRTEGGNGRGTNPATLPPPPRPPTHRYGTQRRPPPPGAATAADVVVPGAKLRRAEISPSSSSLASVRIPVGRFINYGIQLERIQLQRVVT